MPSQHKHNNLTFRPPESDRAWLLAYVARTGRPRNGVLAEALARYRKHVEQQEAATEDRS